MTKLPKFESAELNIIKEFVPANPELPTNLGRLVVRADNYGSRLATFDEFFDIMAADALTFEPPIELDRNDVEIVHYGGRIYSRTFGLEVSIPQGHVVPEDYVRLQERELIL